MGPWWTTPRTAIAAVLTLVLTGCGGGSPEPSPTPAASSAPTDSLESTIQRFMDDGVSSTVVQVRWPGGEWSKAYGQRGPDGSGPAQPQDRFSIASVTKSMVAAAVLQLVDDGLIGLDDPVNGLLESFSTTLKPPGPTTVRQLLNHTSGMPDFVGALDKTGTPKEAVTTASSGRLDLSRHRLAQRTVGHLTTSGPTSW
ncbi:MAG TPA: serine hydrolase [Arthrobacter sp.]|nr:serine hydrolase [Arthrobacter sp.]